jgi:hypothetical protein
MRMILVYIFGYFLFVCLIITHQDMFSDKFYEFVITGIITLIAAWAGGWAAFKAERSTREDAARKTRISAANKALYTVSIMFSLFNNFRQSYIDKNPNLRKDECRALLMDSPQPGMMQAVHFDFDSISYFLDQDGDVPMVLVELQSLDWNFQMLLNTVEMRAQAMEELRILCNGSLTILLVKQHYGMQLAKLNALTDTLIEMVDNGIDTTKRVDGMMRKALQLIFPSQSFLQINFSEKPL